MRISKTLLFALAATTALPVASLAQQAEQSAGPIEEVVVFGVRQRLSEAGLMKNVIEKTEVIGTPLLEATHAVSLTEALSEAPGAHISNDCSMCGLKRIRLNGLRAEHTTILIDGLPSHTIISGFYAVDGLAMTGVEQIEIARGAGASLTAPEAIGGVVNVITTEALENGMTVDLSSGEVGYQQLGLLGTLNTNDGNTRVTFISQYDNRDQFDADGNGMSENPLLENASFTVRLSQDFGDQDNLIVRVNRTQQESFGGPVIGDTIGSIAAALASYDDAPTPADQLFAGNDVGGRWLGKPWETTEWVDTARTEITASWLREINSDWNLELSTSFAEHRQNSFYEGFDYVADDDMKFANARINHYVNDEHFLTFGMDYRTEQLVSRSRSGQAANLDDDPDTIYVSDSFDYDVAGAYIQDTWYITDDLEIKTALRFDSVTADFTDPTKIGTEISTSVISPRIDGRYYHNDRWISRFSAGRGYRAPLSFFETDHGLLDGGVGFEIDVTQLERSKSLSYALSHERDRLSATMSLAWTEVSNLAALDETDEGVPVMTQLDQNATVTAVDLAVTYQIGDHLTAAFVAEHFNYDEQFKQSYAIAPLEEQVTASIDWGIGQWDLYVALAWVGGRDLNEYAYMGYSRLGDATSLKTTSAPSYSTMDFRLSRFVGDNWSFYVGANNLFNYTQAGDEDTPLHWVSLDPADSFDVAYIYGPLRGREIYSGLKYEF